LRRENSSHTLGQMRFDGWLGWLLAASLGVGCSATTGLARFPAERISVPDDSQIYTSAARPDGVVGGVG